MYEGEVFTYRNDRPTRGVTRPQQPRPASPDLGRAEALAAAERMARLEATVLRLEESLSHLTGVVSHLAGALEEAEVEAARTKSVAVAVAPSPSEPDVAEAVVPKVSVQMIKQDERPAPQPPQDVKVSLFAGNSTEAILGQVKVTHTS
ncbi:MAG TPA: hypothetical protein VNT75_30260 [Symbiobacteriaceae bacterium]|nr:hypothetical protein [Symbiobacteriaceae bacterium]